MKTPRLSSAAFDQFARGWRGYLLVALLALISSQFGAARTPVWDADEARFVQATRQMLETGDFVRIRFQDEERNRKPIGAHWAQAAAVRALAPGRLNDIWPYRAPSAIGLVLAAMAALWGGSALVGMRAAFLGACLLAVSALAGFEAANAKADALLLGFTTLAFGALAHLRSGGGNRLALSLIFWTALAAGVLVKGPVTPLVVGLALGCLALWERRGAWTAPLWQPFGPALALALVVPWALAISAATEGRFFADMILADIAPKLLSGHEGHFAPPGYHLLLLSLLIFPATYALPAAARLAFETVRAPRDDAAHAPTRFLVAWVAPAFLFFELAPTKLPHYPLPTYPAIALLCGAGLMAMRGRAWRTVSPMGLALFGVAGGVLAAAMAAGSTLMAGDLAADLRRALSTALFAAAPLIAALFALILLRRPTTRVATLIACALILSFSLRERLLPDARLLFPSDEAATALARARLLPTDRRPLWVVGYDEASIVFLTRTSIRLASPEEAGAHAQPGDAIIVESRALQRASAELAANHLLFQQAEPPVRGYALGRGANVSLYIGQARSSAAETPR